ncbi:Uncharacterised protein [Mycobacteroides abscessus subsp. massiliense]|nr:Uncharacterised protein [Mycobacteroides abscessus subsp. massiliense]
MRRRYRTSAHTASLFVHVPHRSTRWRHTRLQGQLFLSESALQPTVTNPMANIDADLLHGTQEAYQAASIVHRGGELAERWSNALSRPKPIFARHNAAVAWAHRRLRQCRRCVTGWSGTCTSCPGPIAPRRSPVPDPNAPGSSRQPVRTAPTRQPTWALQCSAPTAIYTPQPAGQIGLRYRCSAPGFQRGIRSRTRRPAGRRN